MLHAHSCFAYTNVNIVVNFDQFQQVLSPILITGEHSVGTMNRPVFRSGA